MGKSLISNPPYNMKWLPPMFAQLEPRFEKSGVPPDSNANFAFVLTALEMIDDKAAFLLPGSVLAPKNQAEAGILEYLIEANLIEAVITCPDSMFESTSISVCILVVNKRKKTACIEFVDMRKTFEIEVRDQNGQFGESSHTKRTYHKKIKVFSQEQIQRALTAISEQKNEPGFCKSASIEDVKEKGYVLNPGRYIEFEEAENKHRSYADIVADYNRVVREKNSLKITMNESLAKSLGLYETFLLMKQSQETTGTFHPLEALIGQKMEKENFITISKNAGEFKVENKSRDSLSVILAQILSLWRQHIMYLNSEENRYLAELRDALLPDLMSGKMKVGEEASHE